jgi:hypothetical protein
MENIQSMTQVDRLNGLDTLIENRKRLIKVARMNIDLQTETLKRGAALLRDIKEVEEYAGLGPAINAMSNWGSAMIDNNNDPNNPAVEQTRRLLDDALGEINDDPEKIRKFERTIRPLQAQYFKALLNKRYNVKGLEKFERELREWNNEANTMRIQIALGHGKNGNKAGASIINKKLKDAGLRRGVLESYLKDPTGRGRKSGKHRRKRNKTTKRKRKTTKRKTTKRRKTKRHRRR